MFALRRFWWKDARQFWPVALFLILTALVTQWLLLRYGGPEIRNGVLGWVAIGWAGLYGCAVGAAAFAGEKETGMLRFLDTLPVSRRWLWTSKSSFAILTTIALGLVLFAVAATGTTEWKLGPNPPPLWMIVLAGMAFLAGAVSWGLFFSSITSNALVAAVLTVVLFLCFTPLMAARIGIDAGGFFEVTAIANLIFGGLMLVASGLVMTLSGPPRGNLLPWSIVRTRRSERMEARIILVIDVGSPGSKRRWPHEVRSLVWQTVREGRGAWLWLAGLGLVLPLFLELTSIGISEPLLIALNVMTGLFAGIQIFGAENRGKTHRFLANQGARPGLVWLVKVSVWFGAMALLWLPLWIVRGVWADPQMDRPETFVYVVPTAIALFSTITVGQFCGMTIRRGITAGVVALVVYMALATTHIALVAGEMMSLGFVVLTPLAMLAVTWAWSGDWMLDRPGYGRWARLAGLVAVASMLLFCGYVGERVWGVAELPSTSRLVLTRYDRSPVTPSAADNAAPIYLQATRAVKPFKVEAKVDSSDDSERSEKAERDEKPENQILAGVDVWDLKTAAWLHENAEALTLTRRASSLPSCEFKPIAGMNLGSGSAIPSEVRLLSRLLVLSIAERQSKSDLAGAWDDLLALFRMSRHFSGPVVLVEGLTGLIFDRTALKLAMRWAADPHQKPETLRKAADDYRGLSKFTIADTVRVEAEILDNTLDLPRDDLRDVLAQVMSDGRKHSYGYGLTTWEHLGLVGLTTPWEVARARRVQAQLAWFEVIIAKAEPAARTPGIAPPDEQTKLQISYLNTAHKGSPILRFLAPGVMGLIDYNDRNEVARRALTQIFALRIYQVEHGGKLPDSLGQLMEAQLLDHLPTDPYTRGVVFGYASSEGQSLLPLGDFEPPSFSDNRLERLRVRKGDYRLLFSIGPDRKSQLGMTNEASPGASGDIIFPLKDGGEEDNASKKDGPG